MKIKKKLILLSSFILVFGFINTNTNAETIHSNISYLSDGVDAVTRVTYKKDEKRPDSIWYDGVEGKGYLYKTNEVYKERKKIYIVTYRGKVRRGPYVPNKIDGELK